MKLRRKFLVMVLVLAFVFGAVNMVAADDHTSGPWYTDTSEYYGNVPYFNVNAEILQLGNDDSATINQNGENYAHIGQGIDFQFDPARTGASSDNEALINQTGEMNEGEINQRGNDNSATVMQDGYSQNSGDRNYAGVGQNGDDMYAFVYQDANDSFVRSSQYGGEGSSVFVMQKGDLNRIRTTQQGDDHFAAVFQAAGSYFNYAKLDQEGNDQTAFIYQGGDKNGALVEQAGSDNWAAVKQHGDHNEARVDQNNATGLSALAVQFGNGNDANITQTN
ncbi:MAG: hypothetical protein UMU04_05025 [Halanaerobiales bacterium]|nr:hypothetical protein [Halanaerobiales bacterium]